MDVDAAVRSRRTHKAFRPDPVDAETLDELLDLARWAPNHHLTNPWRFRVLGPAALERLKQAAEAAKPGSARKLDRAPTLVVVSARQTGDAVQDREDLLACGVAAYIVLLGGACPRPRRVLAHAARCSTNRPAGRRSGSGRTRSRSALCTSAGRSTRPSRRSGRRSRTSPPGSTKTHRGC